VSPLCYQACCRCCLNSSSALSRLDGSATSIVFSARTSTSPWSFEECGSRYETQLIWSWIRPRKEGIFRHTLQAAQPLDELCLGYGAFAPVSRPLRGDQRQYNQHCGEDEQRDLDSEVRPAVDQITVMEHQDSDAGDRMEISNCFSPVDNSTPTPRGSPSWPLVRCWAKPPLDED